MDTMDEPVPLPPAKRQKLGDGSASSSAVPLEPEADGDPVDGMSDVSEDTEGSVPSSPINARPGDDDEFQEQITVCAWEGCTAGDQGNMDKLVEHIHNDHIEGRQKKYTCEWIGCTRKSMSHASGYALKAHMRSHTREKPFYCYLPGRLTFRSSACMVTSLTDRPSTECDRSFTRSDALAKHMRTVHETEALRPSDPIPKSLQSGNTLGKSSKLKIVIKKSHGANTSGQDDLGDDSLDGDDMPADFFTQLTEDQGFSTKELAMPLERLHVLCRLQVKWAERDGEELRKDWKHWEEVYRQEWLEKEILLDQVIKSELDWSDRRRAVLSGEADVQILNGASNGTPGTKVGGEAPDTQRQGTIPLEERMPDTMEE
jgi:hypothetical protein